MICPPAQGGLKVLSEIAIEEQQKKTLLKRFEGCFPKIPKVQKQGKNKKKLKRSNDCSATHLMILELLKQNHTIPFMAEKRELSVETIVGHLEKLLCLKQIDLVSIDCLVDLLSVEDLDRIMTELNHSEDGRLKPIYEKFEGRYSYAAFRVARLFLDR